MPFRVRREWRALPGSNLLATLAAFCLTACPVTADRGPQRHVPVEVSVQVRGRYGGTSLGRPNLALVRAINHNDAGAVAALLHQGADPNMGAGGAGIPALYFALQFSPTGPPRTQPAQARRNMRIIHMLLDRGANVRWRGRFGSTLLGMAAEFASPQALRLLIDRGADVNTRDTGGMTALMLTRGPDTAQKVRLLLSRGADVNARDTIGGTALVAASAVGDYSPAIVNLLLARGAGVNTRTADGETALMLAAQSGAVAKVRLLLSHGAAVNARAKDGSTALSWAVRNGAADVVRLLKALGAKS